MWVKIIVFIDFVLPPHIKNADFVCPSLGHHEIRIYNFCLIGVISNYHR